jgi:hypothetical protein
MHSIPSAGTYPQLSKTALPLFQNLYQTPNNATDDSQKLGIP